MRVDIIGEAKIQMTRDDRVEVEAPLLRLDKGEVECSLIESRNYSIGCGCEEDYFTFMFASSKNSEKRERTLWLYLSDVQMEELTKKILLALLSLQGRSQELARYSEELLAGLRETAKEEKHIDRK